MSKIVIITDAWEPQTNGVVRTYQSTVKRLREKGYEVDVIEASMFKSLPLPHYKEIEVALPGHNFLKKYENEKDIAFHIATEGSLGVAARILLSKMGWDYTSSFCTLFPDYLKKYLFIPTRFTWKYMSWLHNGANQTMVSTSRMKELLEKNGIKNIKMWARGVDTSEFYPLENKSELQNDKPIALYVGRVSKEKNIEAFLDCKNEVQKVVVGDGPYLEYLKNKYPDVIFTGKQKGENLRKAYQMADVFVFPSKSDTFGLVMVEALACGVPIAGYPIQGPLDILGGSEDVGTCSELGCLDNNLELAIDLALVYGKSDSCIKRAKDFNWDNCTKLFLSNLIFNESLNESKIPVY